MKMAASIRLTLFWCLLGLMGFVSCWPSAAKAHSINMAVLQVVELKSRVFQLQWVLTPRSGSVEQAYRDLGVTFPEGCQFKNPTLDCANLQTPKASIAFNGLGNVYSALVVRLQPQNGNAQAITLTPHDSSLSLDGSAGLNTWDMARNYIPIGMEHILFGIDHLLFVLGLLWLVRGGGALIKTITAFTLAHSITLTAATLGWVGLPAAPVEALIALSIVLVAVEAVKQHQGKLSLTSRKPWLVAFAFGLLHGFGFAGALGELGLPENNLLSALLFFNIGVELGQLFFVVVLLLVSWVVSQVVSKVVSQAFKNWANLLQKSRQVSQYTVGILAAFWFFERIAGFTNGA